MKKESFKCLKCPSVFKSEIRLINHETENHMGRKCNECDSTFIATSKRSWYNHQRKHRKEICPNCKLFFQSVNFMDHFEKCLVPKIEAKSVRYFCDTCSFKAESRKRLAVHLAAKHIEKPVVIHNCNFCDYKSKRQCNVKRHEDTCKSKYENIVFV